MRGTAGTREKANELAGCKIPPCRPGVIPADEMGDPQKAFAFDLVEIDGLAHRQETLFAPLFNLTDGSAMTQGELGDILSEVMGIKVDYVRPP